MSAFAGWNRDQPSGASSLRASDDQIRSHNSILQALLEEEHYFTDGSATSAGEHKLGSARIWSGASSAISASGRSGGLMWDETNSQLVAVHVATTTRVPALATANTWAAAQTFSSTIAVTGNATLSGLVGIGAAPGAGEHLVIEATDPMLRIEDTTAYDGAPQTLLDMRGRYTSAGGVTSFARIVAGKENATDGTAEGFLAFYTHPGGSIEEQARITSAGVLCVGTTVTTSGAAGDIIIPNLRHLRGVAASGAATGRLIGLNASDQVEISPSGTSAVTLGSVASTSGASGGDLVIANDRAIRGVNSSGTSTVVIGKIDSSGYPTLGTGTSHTKLGYIANASLVSAGATANGVVAIDSTNNRLVFYANGNRYYITGTSF